MSWIPSSSTICNLWGLILGTEGRPATLLARARAGTGLRIGQQSARIDERDPRLLGDLARHRLQATADDRAQRHSVPS